MDRPDWWAFLAFVYTHHQLIMSIDRVGTTNPDGEQSITFNQHNAPPSSCKLSGERRISQISIILEPLTLQQLTSFHLLSQQMMLWHFSLDSLDLRDFFTFSLSFEAWRQSINERSSLSQTKRYYSIKPGAWQVHNCHHSQSWSSSTPSRRASILISPLCCVAKVTCSGSIIHL